MYFYLESKDKPLTGEWLRVGFVMFVVQRFLYLLRGMR